MIGKFHKERGILPKCMESHLVLPIVSSLAPYFGKAPLFWGFAQQLPFALDQIGPRDCNYLEIYMQPSLTYSKRLGNIPSMAQTFYTFLTTNHVVKLIMRAAPLSHYRPKPFVSTDGCRLLPTAICRHRPLPFLWCHFCSHFQFKISKKQGYSLAKFMGFGGEV